MLLDAGAVLTIVGHSERRDAQRESDEEVKAKAEAALAVRPRRDPVRRRKPRGARAGRGRRDRARAARRFAPARAERARPSSPSPTSRSGRSAPARSPTARRNRARCTRRIRAPARAASASRGTAGADSLRRLGQGLERGRNLRDCRCRRRAGRRRQPQGRGFHADRRRGRGRPVEALRPRSPRSPPRHSQKARHVRLPADRSIARSPFRWSGSS